MGAGLMADEQTKAELARLRAERRALAAAKKAGLADIREARVRHRWNALVAGG